MATPVSELQKINPSNIVELFQLQLDTTIHGANTTYYFHNGVNEIIIAILYLIILNTQECP